MFDKSSKDEWFDSYEEAQKFFFDEKNFNNLINQKYEKLNVQFSIILLRDYKIIFDNVFLQTLKSFSEIPPDIIDNLSKIVFAQFPPLNKGDIKLKSQIDCRNKLKPRIDDMSNSNIFQYHFPINKIQKQLSVGKSQK